MDPCPAQSVGPGCSSRLTPGPLLRPASWSPSSAPVVPLLPQLPESSACSTASILAFPCLKFRSDSAAWRRECAPCRWSRFPRGQLDDAPTVHLTHTPPAASPLHPALPPQKGALASVRIPDSEASLTLASRPRVPSHHLTLFLIVQGSAQMPPPPRSPVAHLSVIRPSPPVCVTCVSAVVSALLLPCVVAFCLSLHSPRK